MKGLRGIASIFVVSSHMVLCFARRLVLPCCGYDEKSFLLFQLPILRLVAQGQAWVAIFFILSGYVNALKPIKLSRAGNVETALLNLAQSSFRRSFRLVLPAAAATVISWAVCQMGAFEIARNSDAYWLYTYTPAPSASWGTGLEDLVNGLRATWTIGIVNPYDQPQWALIYLFQGSMMVFIGLLITINLTPFYRSLTLTLFALWSFDLSYKFKDRSSRYFLGCPILTRTLLTLPYSSSRVHHFRRHFARRILPLFLSSRSVTILALYFTSACCARFSPDVLSFRCTSERDMDKRPPCHRTSRSSSSSRIRSLVGIYRGTCSSLLRDYLSTHAHPAFSSSVVMAGENQLSDLLASRNIDEKHLFMDDVFGSRAYAAGDKGWRRSNVHSHAIPLAGNLSDYR